jgi:hypothetical protein
MTLWISLQRLQGCSMIDVSLVQLSEGPSVGNSSFLGLWWSCKQCCSSKLCVSWQSWCAAAGSGMCSSFLLVSCW